eukprot:6581252-Pyramimonas_sp.AAC.2
MQRGWPHCKIYLRTITKGCCIFLKEMGNRVNENFTATTVIEKLRALDQISLGWDTFRDGKDGWDWNTLGQSVYAKKRYDYVEVGRGACWGNARHVRVGT